MKIKPLYKSLIWIIIGLFLFGNFIRWIILHYDSETDNLISAMILLLIPVAYILLYMFMAWCILCLPEYILGILLYFVAGIFKLGSLIFCAITKNHSTKIKTKGVEKKHIILQIRKKGMEKKHIKLMKSFQNAS